MSPKEFLISKCPTGSCPVLGMGFNIVKLLEDYGEVIKQAPMLMRCSDCKHFYTSAVCHVCGNFKYWEVSTDKP